MTIEENMALAYLRAAQRSGVFSTIRAKDRAAFREQLAALGLGLEDRLSQPVGLLSGGQRQAADAADGYAGDAKAASAG